MFKHSFSLQLASAFASIIVLLLITMFLINLKMTEINSVSNLIQTLRLPTSQASKQLELGIQSSLGALRGWMILGDEQFKLSREKSWAELIHPAMSQLQLQSANWTVDENRHRLAIITTALKKFETYQLQAEELAFTKESVPATQILMDQAAPLAKNIISAINNMIDLEAAYFSTPDRRKLLKALADFRGKFALALSDIRIFLLSGDPLYKDDFYITWTDNEKAFKTLMQLKYLMSTDQKILFASLILNRNGFTPLPQEMFIIRESEKANLANYILAQKAAPEAASILSELGEMTTSQIALLETDFLSNKDSIANLSITVNLLFALTIVFCMTLGLLITRAIVRPIKEAITIASSIGRGDLTSTESLTGSSEIAALSISFNEMQSQIIERTQAMKNSETMSRGIIEGAIDAIITIDDTGNILSCNASTLSLFKYTETNIIDKKINLLIPKLNCTDNDSYLKKIIDTGIEKHISNDREADAVNSDGLHFPIKLSINEIKLPAKSVLTCFIRDITEEKTFENKIKTANYQLTKQNNLKTQVSKIAQLTQGATKISVLANKLISLLAEMTNSGHGVFFIVNDDSNNEPSLTLAGSYAFKQRKHLVSSLPFGEGLVGQCAIEMKPILLTQVPADYIQINSTLGEQRPFNILVQPILFEHELMAVIELASFSAFTEDDQEMLNIAAENIGIAINKINQNKTNQLLDETRQQAEELKTQQNQLTLTNDALQKQTSQLKESEEELKQQSEELKSSNEELYEQQQALIKQKEEILISKEELSHRAADLTKASKYKSEFLANMSHELRTPLNSLLLLAKSLTENKNGNLNAVEVEDARIIHSGGNSLLLLINDILDLSKVEAGKITIHKELTPIETVLLNLKQIFIPIAKDRDLELIVEVSPNLPFAIVTDGQRLEQIIRNLLSNALKFTPQGSVKLKISPTDKMVNFTETELTPETSISFAVIDSGIGIPSDKIQAIFEAFQQQDGSTSRQYGGTGLGLTIAKEFTQLLGGELQVNSVLDEGSCFTLYLPLITGEIESANDSICSKEVRLPAITDDQEPKSEKDNDYVLNQSTGSYAQFIDDDRDNLIPEEKHLLVIDDDPHFAKILKQHVNNSGYKCLVAGDGRSGIYLATEYQPKGILLDMSLPDIDGHQVLEQLKSTPKTHQIPVQVLSAHTEETQTLIEQGAIGLLTKPVTSEDLQHVICQLKTLVNDEEQKVLLVDSNKETQKATINLFKDETFNLHSVSTGKEAITELTSSHYSCVIVDLELSDMNCFELLQHIKTGQYTPSIIIYTDRELTNEEHAQLDQNSYNVIVKGKGGSERLLDDISIFMHEIEIRDDASNSSSHLHPNDENIMLKGRKILLVDDDMRNSYALSKYMLEVGFDIDMACNGEEAIEMLTKNTYYELVLMDIMMPIMDGIEATKQIRKMSVYKDLPIIAITAKTMPEDKEKCLQAGASEYLTKPIDFDKLMSILRIWLFKPN